MSYANGAIGILQRKGYTVSATLTLDLGYWLGMVMVGSGTISRSSAIEVERDLKNGERIPSLYGKLAKITRVELRGTHPDVHQSGSIIITPDRRIRKSYFGTNRNYTSEDLETLLLKSGKYKKALTPKSPITVNAII